MTSVIEQAVADLWLPIAVLIMRASWVSPRKGQANVSQMHYARQGVVTEEMAYVAKRENLPESLGDGGGGPGPHDHPRQHQSHRP